MNRRVRQKVFVDSSIPGHKCTLNGLYRLTITFFIGVREVVPVVSAQELKQRQVKTKQSKDVD